MVYSPTEGWDLFLILCCMTSYLLYLSFSTLFFSSSWRTDTIVFAKLNWPPSQISPPPSNVFEISPPSNNPPPPKVCRRNPPPPPRLNRGFIAFFTLLVAVVFVAKTPTHQLVFTIIKCGALGPDN